MQSFSTATFKQMMHKFKTASLVAMNALCHYSVSECDGEHIQAAKMTSMLLCETVVEVQFMKYN